MTAKVLTWREINNKLRDLSYALEIREMEKKDLEREIKDLQDEIEKWKEIEEDWKRGEE